MTTVLKNFVPNDRFLSPYLIDFFRNKYSHSILISFFVHPKLYSSNCSICIKSDPSPNAPVVLGSVGSVGSNFSATSQHGVEAESANATTPPLLLPWGTNPYMPMVVLSMPSTSNVASNLVNVLANSPLRPRFTSLSENIQPDAGNKPIGPMMLPMGGIDTSGIGLPNGNLHDGKRTVRKNMIF